MCAACGCGKKKGEPGYGKGKKADKAQDAKVMKGMSPKDKSSFKKADKAMDKKSMTQAQDTKKDKALAKKIKAKKK
jgi:hypothetical protein